MLFENARDVGVRVRSLPDDLDEAALVVRIRATRTELAAWVTYYGLVAQQYSLKALVSETGISTPVGTFDVRLTDNKDWAGVEAVGLYWDIARIRDFWIDEILGPCSVRGAAALEVDLTCMRATESLIRAIAQPQESLVHAYKVIEHIRRRLGGERHFAKIGLTKSYVDFVTKLANKVPDDRSRHAHSASTSSTTISDVEIAECLRRTRRVLEAYAVHASV